MKREARYQICHDALKGEGKQKASGKMLLELRRRATEEQQAQRQATGIYFDTYLETWLKQMQLTVSPTTFRAYSTIIHGSICPYFKPLNLLISELKPRHIAEYYDSLLNRGLSPVTVRRHHANIHKVLKRAVVDGLLQRNPADCMEPPKQAKYTAAYYSADECRDLLAAVKGSELELPVVLTLFWACAAARCWAEMGSSRFYAACDPYPSRDPSSPGTSDRA